MQIEYGHIMWLVTVVAFIMALYVVFTLPHTSKKILEHSYVSKIHQLEAELEDARSTIEQQAAFNKDHREIIAAQLDKLVVEKAENRALQNRIDELMARFCPKDMTEEQALRYGQRIGETMALHKKLSEDIEKESRNNA